MWEGREEALFIGDLNFPIKELFISKMELNHKEAPQPVYCHQFPFRFVQPYAYTYRTFTKGRWVGKPLLPTLIKEFKAYPP
jgi:hypothetical protein